MKSSNQDTGSLSSLEITQYQMATLTSIGQRHVESYTQETRLPGTLLVTPGRLAPGTSELAVSGGCSAASKAWRARPAMPR